MRFLLALMGLVKNCPECWHPISSHSSGGCKLCPCTHGY